MFSGKNKLFVSVIKQGLTRQVLEHVRYYVLTLWPLWYIDFKVCAILNMNCYFIKKRVILLKVVEYYALLCTSSIPLWFTSSHSVAFSCYFLFQGPSKITLIHIRWCCTRTHCSKLTSYLHNSNILTLSKPRRGPNFWMPSHCFTCAKNARLFINYSVFFFIQPRLKKQGKRWV